MCRRGARVSHDCRIATVCDTRVCACACATHTAVHQTLRRLNLKKQAELPDAKTTEEEEGEKNNNHMASGERIQLRFMVEIED